MTPKRRTFLAIGIILVVLAGILFRLPNTDDRVIPASREGLSLTHSKDIMFENLGFNFITTIEPHFIHISYYFSYNQSKNNFVAFVIPFDILRLEDPTHQWRTKEFNDIHTTVIYKNITKTTDTSLRYDGNNMVFLLKNRLDSKQLATHSIFVPFASSVLDPRALVFVDGLASPAGDIINGWRSLRLPAEVRFTVDSKTDRLNAIPGAQLEQFFRTTDNATSHVLSWNLTSGYEAFYLEYEIPEQRQMYETLQQVGLVLFGTGASVLVEHVISALRKRSLAISN